MDELVSDALLALGTVQWGLPYGIANRTGQPRAQEVSEMIDLARASSITTLDTARAYGESEAVIGRVVGDDPSFQVVTKTDPGILEGATSEREAVGRLLDSLATSRALLGRRLDTVLLHRPEQRVALGGAVWNALVEERERGNVDRIGISALSPEDAFAGLEDPNVTVMQVASSLLDRRLHEQGFFKAAQARGVEVHVRSVFLQGSAFLPSDALPPGLAPLAPSIRLLDELAEGLEVPRPVLFWAWARELGASRLLVGCERVEQLQDHLRWFKDASIIGLAVRRTADLLPELGADVLDPSQWS